MNLSSRPSFWIISLFLAILTFSSNAYAHRVNVFAYVEGTEVFTESYFSKKKKVHQGKVEVFNSKDGKLLLSGITDDNGNFNFPVPNQTKTDKSGLFIVLHASEGHRGEWTLAADEIFPDASPLPSTSATSPVIIKSTQTSNSELNKLNTQVSELNSKVDALKRLIINQQENGPGANEIFSGIGYILGLFGVAAFFVSRKK